MLFINEVQAQNNKQNKNTKKKKNYVSYLLSLCICLSNTTHTHTHTLTHFAFFVEYFNESNNCTEKTKSTTNKQQQVEKRKMN